MPYADFGVEHSVPINGLDNNTINAKLEELVKKGESMPRCAFLCVDLLSGCLLWADGRQDDCLAAL